MITPSFVIVAILSLLLDQVPPVLGYILVVSPIHIELGPVNTISVGSFTVNGED